jgi:lysophospholipase L1-like esterase
MKHVIFCVFFAASVLSGRADSVTRIACVGDSITCGATIRDRANHCYPKVLGDLLGKEYTVRNYGVNGATLLKNGDRPYWKLGAFKQATDFGPNVVILKLGTNDTKPQNWGKAGKEYEADLRAMVTHFKSLPIKPTIYLCLPAPVYQTRWGINEKTVKEGVIPVIRKVAKDEGLTVIDLYQALSGKPALFPDKIHPNAAGAKLMAQTIHTVLKKKH